MKEKKCWSLTVLEIFITPFVLVGFGYFIQDALNKKEANSRLVELSIQILTEKPNPEKIPIRKWAVDVINEYSPIKFNNRAKHLLIFNAHFVSELRDDTVLFDDTNIGVPPRFIESQPQTESK